MVDELQLFFEVSFPKDRAVALQTLVVHGKALDGKLLDYAGRPLAELDGTLGIHLVAHGDDSR